MMLAVDPLQKAMTRCAKLGDIERKAKKSGLYWSVRAYLLNQIGEREAAQQVLAKGVRKPWKIQSSRQPSGPTKRQEDEDEVLQHAVVSASPEKPPMVMQQNPMQPRCPSATARSLKVDYPHKLLQSCRGTVRYACPGCVSSPPKQRGTLGSFLLSFPLLANIFLWNRYQVMAKTKYA